MSKLPDPTPEFEDLAIAEFRAALKHGQTPRPELTELIGSMLLRYIELRDTHRPDRRNKMYERFAMFSRYKFALALGKTKDEAVIYAAGDQSARLHRWLEKSEYTFERDLAPDCPSDGIDRWLTDRQTEMLNLVELEVDLGRMSQDELRIAIGRLKEMIAAKA